MTLDGRQARRRFLALRFMRWFPTGFLLPVMIVLMRQRGLSLAEIALVAAVQGAVILVLELPTGGLADALGRRPVLLAAGVFDVASHVLLLVADAVPLFVASWFLQGVYRSLDSGPQEAWYVDASLAADPNADFERGLAQGSVAIGVAVAGGSLLGGALVGVAPLAGVDPLLLPILVSLALRLVDLALIAALMTEVRRAGSLAAVRASVRAVPAVVVGALRLLRGSSVLAALVAVELLWGAGMTTFETLFPPRLVQLLGDPEAAVALLGGSGAVAWVAAAGGAAAVPGLVRLLGGSAARAGIALRAAQGLGVLAMAAAGGAAGLVVAYVAVYAVHGASNPVHYGLVHRAVGSEHRTTVHSANSLAGHGGGALGAIGFGALADAASIPVAMVVGALVLAVAAPLYVLAGRGMQEPVKPSPAAKAGRQEHAV